MKKVTNEQIRALRAYAERTGNIAWVELCNHALKRGGCRIARTECARVIAARAAEEKP